jgi:hypothetical protein
VREKKKDKGNVLFPSPSLSTPHSTQGDYPTLGVSPHQKKLTCSPVLAQEEDKPNINIDIHQKKKKKKKKRKVKLWLTHNSRARR